MKFEKTNLVSGSIKGLTLPTSETVPTRKGILTVHANAIKQVKEDNTVASLKISSLFGFDSHTFTPASSSGRTGPTLAQCRNAYSTSPWVNDSRFFNVQSGIQIWTVPNNGTYRISAYGAGGGGGTDSTNTAPGKGAFVRGDFDLIKGQKLFILVGQLGGRPKPNSGNCGGGGGGASYVVSASQAPLIAAAGGNGENWGSWNTDGPDGRHALTTTSAGGAGARGAGGAGFLQNGADATQGNSTGGVSYRNGGTGGTADSAIGGGLAHGGFGGGGGSRWEGGGGGGYRGGSVVPSNQYNTSFNSGALSFNAGVNRSGTTGSNIGHGKVIIERLL